MLTHGGVSGISSRGTKSIPPLPSLPVPPFPFLHIPPLSIPYLLWRLVLRVQWMGFRGDINMRFGAFFKGVARNLLRGTKQGVWGTETPSGRGPWAEPRWGSAAKPPEARDTC